MAPSAAIRKACPTSPNARSPTARASPAATLSLGQVTVPLSIKLQADEIPYRINHAEVKLVAVSNLSVEKVLAVWSSYDHPVQVLYFDNDVAISLTY